jgi:hypothetical protein
MIMMIFKTIVYNSKNSKIRRLYIFILRKMINLSIIKYLLCFKKVRTIFYKFT